MESTSIKSGDFINLEGKIVLLSYWHLKQIQNKESPYRGCQWFMNLPNIPKTSKNIMFIEKIKIDNKVILKCLSGVDIIYIELTNDSIIY